MTDTIDAITIETTPLLTAMPEDGVFLIRTADGNLVGLPRQLLPSGSANQPTGPLTISDGGLIGQAADRILDGGLVGQTADLVLDGGLVGQTGDGITAQQFCRGDPGLWGSPGARLRQAEPGVVLDPLTGAVLGLRIGKGVPGDPLATTAVADNPLLQFYPDADREKLEGIQEHATAAGAAGDAHAQLDGNPHSTGIDDIAGLQDAIDARSALEHTHTPDEVGLDLVTNDRQLKEDLTAYPEKTSPEVGDFIPLRDGPSGEMRRFNWSRLPSGGSSGSANPSITFVTTTAELLAALADDKKIIFLGSGTFSYNTTLRLNGAQLIGAGRGRTTLIWTGGASPAISAANPTSRSYNSGLYGFTLNNQGSGTIGIEWASISAGNLQNLHVTGFATQYALVGPNGYCVYNRLYDCAAQGGSCGFLIGATGSNSNSLIACRGNLIVGWCVDIVGSNDTLISGGQWEGSTAGIRVRSDAVADGDGTNICFNRFENLNGGSGGIAVQIDGANTRDAQVILNYLASTGGTINNNSPRTIIISQPYAAGAGPMLALNSPYAIADGAFRLSRSAAANDVPMLVLSDTNTGSGTPITLELNTERPGGTFWRGRRGGVTYARVTADGKGLFAGGIGVGNSVAASSMGALTRKLQVFDADGNSLGFVPIHAS